MRALGHVSMVIVINIANLIAIKITVFAPGCYASKSAHTVPENIHIMKFRISRELKNMILSINLAILTFFKLFVQFSETF